MDAVERLRKKAQNEATCLALNNECKHLRQQLAECKSKWEHFENSVAEKSMQCLSLEKELAECQKAFETECRDIDLILNHFGMDINKFRTECGFLNKYHIASELRHLQNIAEKLAECQRERDEYLRDLGAMKNWIADWHKKDAELATVIKERDELKANSDRYELLRDMKLYEMQHVYPVNDLREHITSGEKCWCNPTVDDGVTIHNAMDGREQFELGRKKT